MYFGLTRFRSKKVSLSEEYFKRLVISFGEARKILPTDMIKFITADSCAFKEHMDWKRPRIQVAAEFIRIKAGVFVYCTEIYGKTSSAKLSHFEKVLSVSLCA